ncbi:dermonecrotic toxin domain-containing protein [Pseudomonas sp. HMWF021]|uniref:dermonecrotic toxin domain-containing protein n=1 Tax=Pseudomonas sp. HMWF021 TaxID=2056857 RepID=UPI000D35AE65|nr:DUF6543 domain-containing protein [Pseudomonas sp. HMWF021]PTT26426.1 hypothetical protein DBR18_22700 [Pseudomonas sp. HMWF021]
MNAPIERSPARSGLSQIIAAQFASRPTLESVTRQLLADTIAEKLPSLQIDLNLTILATPYPEGGWTLRPLIPLVLDYLAGGAQIDLRNRYGLPCYLSDAPPKRLRLSDRSPVDLTVVAAIINELPWTLPVSLQNQLASYWQEKIESGVSRWRWLSDQLKGALQATTLEKSDLDADDRATLDQVVGWPDSGKRQEVFGETAVRVYCLEAVLTQANLQSRRLSPELLLIRQSSQRVLLCKPGGDCEGFASLQAFTGVWGTRLATDLQVDQVTVNRYEPDGNIFDTQAAIILNRQLEALRSLRLPASEGLQALLSIYREITDPQYDFLDARTISLPAPSVTRSALPQWLQGASPVDRMTYRYYSLALANAKKRYNGRTFLSDIDDIQTFTNAALLKQLKLDEGRLAHPEAGQSGDERFQPEDLQLTFAVAAGYPGGAGFVEKETMSLTELAIRNLAARPHGQLTITHRKGLTLPAWLTPDYIQRSGGLIEQVDIGKTYPRMLESRLLGDDPRIRQREASFAEQTMAQLPLQALELKLRRQNGFTAKGVRMVCALTNEQASERILDGQEVVIRQLALVRKPGAAADIVTNMFIIEMRDFTHGPHILYRPLYAQPLHEFASRQQLLDALAQPGDLQSSVLTWLSDTARPVYANGGFLEPHYVRFGIGSEFGPIERPRPATLATNGVSDQLLMYLANGKLMQHLYGSNARTLVDQAERESVSNSESRWAVLMEGANLLFGTLLLPLLRGPFMLTAWLYSLASSASHDIPALNSQDPVTRELALVDLLLNVSMVLLQFSSSTAPVPRVAERIRQRALQQVITRRSPGQWPAPRPAATQEGVVALATQSTGSGHTVFDFSFSSARAQLTPGQRERLMLMQVPPPVPLPERIASGRLTGLYRTPDEVYTQIDSQWYRVRVNGNVANAPSVVIISPSAPIALGPALKTDGEGNWSLDLNLRLRGGMPRERIAAARQRKAQRIEDLTQAFDQLLTAEADVQKKADDAERVMNLAARGAGYSDDVLARTRRKFDEALHSQIDDYVRILDTLNERNELGIPVPAANVAIMLENIVKNARKSVVVADMDREALYATNEDFTILNDGFSARIAANLPRYTAFIKQLVGINDRQMHSLELKDRYLAELFDLGGRGKDAYERLTRDRPDEITALGVKYLQLQSLKFAIVKDWSDFPFAELDELFLPLSVQVRTHSQLKLFELSAEERLAVLESLNEHYAHALDVMQGWSIVHAERFEMNAFDRLQKMFEDLYQDVTKQLAAEIKPAAQSSRRPPKRPMVSVGKPQKKVIKTRKRGMLIGDLRPAGSGLSIDTVELRSELDDTLLVTYSQHGDVWDEVLKSSPPQLPAPQPAFRALDTIKGDARKLLKKLDETVQREERYAKVSRYPVEIQESLQHEANRYADIAAELDRAIEAQPKASQSAADREIHQKLINAVSVLKSKGEELRVQQSLALPPTHANLAFLLQKNKLQVARLGARVATQGERNDFIQEYAINDRQGYAVWYAHFHYPRADSPKQEFTAAHMKTREQRKENYHSLLARAESDQRVVDVHRGMIGMDLAQRHFLPLAP